MANFNLSNSLKGNKNAAGPHVKRFGAVVAKKAGAAKTVVAGKLGLVKKPSQIGSAIAQTNNWIGSGAAIGAAKGLHAVHKGSKLLGAKSTGRMLAKGALTGAKGAARGNVLSAIGVGAATYAAGKYMDHKRSQTLRGKAENAARKVVTVVKKTIKKVRS